MERDGDAKEPVNFRLGREYKDALRRLAEQRGQSMGQLVREAVEGYVNEQRRAAWEAEARRAAAEIEAAAGDPSSDEAEMLRILDENLEAFAEEWVWTEESAE